MLRRRTSRRRQLVEQSTATKNSASAVLVRNLKRRPELSDLFGKAGRAWLEALELPQSGASWTDLEGGPGSRAPRARRGSLVGCQLAGPAAGLRPAHRGSAREQRRHVAVARKLCVLSWHLLTRGEDYAFARPSLVRRKLRTLELRAGAPRRRLGPTTAPVWGRKADDKRERELVERAEASYRRLVSEWQASRPSKRGAGATPGRASSRPSVRQAARQTSKPQQPAL
jgi:hypothetical protein